MGHTGIARECFAQRGNRTRSPHFKRELSGGSMSLGYVYCDDRVAFVLNSFLERFINDTVDYNIHYVGVESLDEECIECRRYFDYCEHILPALWIDDDFLNNEKLEFDYEKFELIDTGIKYLNPKHFSVKSFVEYCRFSKE